VKNERSANSQRSATLFEEAKRVLPGGVERIDFANNMASLIHGHGHPAIVDAVTAQLARGSAFTMATEVEIELARHLCDRCDSFDKVRFMNSGTEAVMAGLKAARAFTGRTRIAKIEGTYHGAYDYAEISQAPAPDTWGERRRPASVPLAKGTPGSISLDVSVFPFDDPKAAIEVLDEHRADIACVLIDPLPHRVGMVPIDPGMVTALREWTTKNGALLMFDEVITFRTEVGGMQQRLGVRPDLTSMGKIIGGGFPVGALAGRDEVMAVFSSNDGAPRLPHSGTFSANPVTMTAGLAAMRLYDAEAVARLDRLGDLARARIDEAIDLSDVRASVTGAGSLFRIHLKADRPTDYRSTFVTAAERPATVGFVDGLLARGVLVIQTGAGALSTAMGEAEIDRLAEAVTGALREVREAGLL
jgi:glutamate-1-semialdehyde 2,1-aminomutase